MNHDYEVRKGNCMMYSGCIIYLLFYSIRVVVVMRAKNVKTIKSKSNYSKAISAFFVTESLILINKSDDSTLDNPFNA